MNDAARVTLHLLMVDRNHLANQVKTSSQGASETNPFCVNDTTQSYCTVVSWRALHRCVTVTGHFSLSSLTRPSFLHISIYTNGLQATKIGRVLCGTNVTVLNTGMRHSVQRKPISIYARQSLGRENMREVDSLNSQSIIHSLNSGNMVHKSTKKEQ